MSAFTKTGKKGPQVGRGFVQEAFSDDSHGITVVVTRPSGKKAMSLSRVSKILASAGLNYKVGKTFHFGGSKAGTFVSTNSTPSPRFVVMPKTASKAPAAIGIEESAYAPSARARALLRGRKIAEADLRDSGGAYELDDVRAMLNGVSRQAVEKRVKEGSLLAIPGPSNRRRYPVAQFVDDGLVAGLKEVQDALPTRNPWAILNFLVRPDSRLGGRKPIDVLRTGDIETVTSAARAMGVQGG